MSIPKLGEKAAESLEKVCDANDYISIEDIRKQSKISSTVVDTMKEMGCFGDLPDSAQTSLF